MALKGREPLTSDELHAAEIQAQGQDQYLDQFRQQALIGQQDLDRAFVARAEQYGAAPWTAAQAIARQQALTRFPQERRVHIGRDKPCDECEEEQAQGWVVTGTLKSVGACTCRQSCHCVFRYMDEDGTEYIAGHPVLD
jgi:hypothetical protein